MLKKFAISQTLLILSWGAITGSLFALILGTDVFELKIADNIFATDIKPGWAAVLGATLSGAISVILFLLQRKSDLKAERKRVALKHAPVKHIISDIECALRELTINLENLFGKSEAPKLYNFEHFINISSGVRTTASNLNQRTKMLQAYDGREYGPDFSDAAKRLLESSELVLASAKTAMISLERVFCSDLPMEVPQDAIDALNSAYYQVVLVRIYPDIVRSEVEWITDIATA